MLYIKSDSIGASNLLRWRGSMTRRALEEGLKLFVGVLMRYRSSLSHSLVRIAFVEALKCGVVWLSTLWCG